MSFSDQALRLLLPDRLSSLLDLPADKGALDHWDAAMHTVFLSPIIAKAVNATLPTLTPFAVPADGLGGTQSVSIVQHLDRDTHKRPLNVYDGDIPESLLQSLGRANGRATIGFVRILLTCRTLMTSGFDIPTTKFARQPWISQQRAGDIRDTLVSKGLLVCTDATSRRGAKGKRGKAQTFVASGELLDALRTLYPLSDRSMPVIPARIADGQWAQVLFELMPKLQFLPLDTVLAKLSQIPGFDQKDRCQQAKRLYRYFKRGHQEGRGSGGRRRAA